jgi:cell division protein FtsL
VAINKRIFPLDVRRSSRYNASQAKIKIQNNVGASVEILLIVLLLFIVLGLAGWLVLLEYRQRQLANSLRLLLTGRGGADLEATLRDFIARMSQIEQTTQAMDLRVTELEVKLPYLVQHIGVVRFNPFSDKGGDQSFVLAILDAHADGAVLSALHGRTDVRVYAKPVIGGQSTYTLTAEEKEAIARAMKPRA